MTEPQKTATLSLKVCVIIMAGVVTLALGIGVATAMLTPLQRGIGAAMLLLITPLALKTALSLSKWPGRYRRDQLVPVVWWMTGATALHVVWGLVFASDLDATQTLATLAALPVLGWVEWIAAAIIDRVLLTPKSQNTRLSLFRRNQPADRAAVVEQVHEGEIVPDDAVALRNPAKARATMRAILDAADYPHLEIQGVRGANAHTMICRVRVPSAALARQRVAEHARSIGASNKGGVQDFSPKSAYDLGLAWNDLRNGDAVHEGAIRVVPTGLHGVYDILLMAVDVMAMIHMYLDRDLRPRSARTPVELGWNDKGDRATLDLYGKFGMIIAKSGAGKTNVISLFLAHWLLTEAVVWIAGVGKMNQTYGYALAKYKNQQVELPVDWIAKGQFHSVDMILAAIMVAEARQNAPVPPANGWPPLFVVIDEAVDILENTNVTVPYGDNPAATAAFLLATFGRKAKSGNVHFVLAVPRETMAELGEYGPMIKSQMDWVLVLKSSDPDLASRVYDNHQTLRRLQYEGEAYLGEFGGQHPDHLKIEYMQEIHKPRPAGAEHDGTMIDEVMWNRRHLVRDRQLDDYSRAAAEQVASYVARHRVYDDEFGAYLVEHRIPEHVKAAMQPAQTTQAALPAGGVDAQLDNEWIQDLQLLAAEGDVNAIEELAKLGVDAAPAAAAAAVARPTLTLVPAVIASTSAPAKLDRKARALQIVTEHRRIHVDQLLGLLAAEGYTTDNRRSVINQLGDHVKAGVIVRDGDDYAVAG